MNTLPTAQPLKAQEFKRYLNETRGLERDYLSELIHSKRLAWRITSMCGAVVMVGLIALGVLAHSIGKPIPPFILRVDNVTGQTDVVSIMKAQQTSYGEVVDKYWLNQYVLNAEGYDYYTIQHSYDLIGLLSVPMVAKNYQQRFVGKEGLDKVLKETGTIVVNVHSIIPDEKNGTATVHFSTLTTYPGQVTGIHKNWIATLAYRYENVSMSESDRLKNPLGFQVTSYRVDPENIEQLSATPPSIHATLGGQV